MSFYRLFKQQAELNPHRIALVMGDQRLSYAQLLASIDQLIAGFHQQGYSTGTIMALALDNCVEYVHILLAASATGVTLVSLHSAMKQDALLRALESTQAQVLIAHAAQFNPQHNPMVDPPITVQTETVPGIAQYVMDGEAVMSDAVKPLQTLYRQAVAIDSLAAVDAAYILCLTSGSTGDPKPIELSQSTKLKRAWGAARLYDIGGTDTCLVSTPLHHSLAQRFTLLPLISGATCVVLQKFTPEKWMQAVAHDQVTFSIAVSSQLKVLLAAFESAPQQLASLKTLVSSSARLPEETRARLLACLECAFHECYGTSEMGIVSNIRADEMQISALCVGLPIAEARVRILSADGQSLPVEQVGEIACLSETAFSGYYKLAKVTQNAHSDHYFLTGDLGKLDDAGRLYYLGRTKELIKTGGVSVYPKDIEDAVMGCEGLLDHCAVGVGDDQLGEVIALVYLLKPGTALSSQAIKRHIKLRCLQKLSDYQIPFYYLELAEFPYTPLGKLQKHKVREMVMSKLGKPQPSSA